MQPYLLRSVFFATLCLPVFAQEKPAKPVAKPATKPAATTWMDLAPGTDVTWSVDDDNTLVSGGGSGSGGSGKHAVRIVSLGADDEGSLRIAVIDEQLPEEAFETAIVRAEIAVLDPATGALRREGGATGPLTAMWSPQVVFPFPTLTAAEWKAKKPVARTTWTPVAGEACELPMVVTFENRKEGKKQVPVLVASLAAKQPAEVRLVGIAGIVAMAQGQMPKLGASGVEPVVATVVELRREFTIEAAKGRVTAVHTTGKVTAGDGKVEIACRSTQTETGRRIVAAKDLPAVVEVVEELCAIAVSSEPKAERKARAEALQEKAKAAGFAATAERLLDSLTRDGLPPGLPR